ncbi:regulatory-associated protein of TOR 1 isoform X1 [Selaginella moellendorffii]|uniref:regulatory-associated protein of TOR 1 isoform X1 n=1 Tax=Selaginella moellendorffii TaxID=88036 RepID=UPI000D1C670B|nr:regulatory-associated protein of TOR 1 isoform X1 [Selaginella moellendorffii]|eukprot:XP_024521729.1 regulatory-associated protein of TOR 1 isoform X1 [Selaginella moellendorffii]
MDEGGNATTRGIAALLPPACYLCDLRHEAAAAAPPAATAAVSKWRMKDRMKTGCVALVLCLNIGIDPPDVIKISPCARMECWIEPSAKAIDVIGQTLQSQYKRWQPKALYNLRLDSTVDEVKKLCVQCRETAKSERVLFHYNGHGVPKPTASGEIWFFNQSYTQYIPLSVYELDSWLGSPSIYVFDCSGAGAIIKAFCEVDQKEKKETKETKYSLACLTCQLFQRPDFTATKNCILLAACGANELLPQNPVFPADLFTACLTTPIKVALRWFCSRSLLRDSLRLDLVDKIPGRQIDRKTPLGELNWIFTAVTDTIAWNVLPPELFQRLFRQDLLVASLFRNFLLAERIMRSANCAPQCYPRLPLTHQHPMWDAWDMAAEFCLAQLPALLDDPNAEFKPSSFFAQQLSAFEVWLSSGSERKPPPEQLPIVLQVLLSQSHRFRALVLLGRFLDMGPWAIDLALSVGIFPYVLKLLQTTATELRQILVFIWTKILALDKSCQVDLVKDKGHLYFIRFLDSPDYLAEQQAMAAFVLSVIVDGYPRGQLACHEAGVVSILLRHVQAGTELETQAEPLFLQWACLCLGKLWDGTSAAQACAFRENAISSLAQLLSEPQPEVRASAVFALGTLLSSSKNDAAAEDDNEDDRLVIEQDIAKVLLRAVGDGSPLVRAELAIAFAHFATNHHKFLNSAAAAYLKPPSNPALADLSSSKSPTGSLICPSQVLLVVRSLSLDQKAQPDVSAAGGEKQDGSNSSSAPSSAPSSGASSPLDGSRLVVNGSNGNGTLKLRRPRAEDNNSLYLRCIATAYALARDTSPQVAELGQKVLHIIGVGSLLNSWKGSGKPGHHRNSSVPSIHLGAGGGLTRSTSWVETNLASLVAPLRSSASPTRPSFLSVSPMGMRRVPSLEFSPSLTARESTRLSSRIPGEASSGLTPTVPKVHSMAGFAEAGSILSATNQTSQQDVPASSLYDWSCGHFSRPLLEPTQDEDGDAPALRLAREKKAVDGISKCQHLHVTKLGDPIWDGQSDNCTRAVVLHPFDPLICAADDKETIKVWNYEEKDGSEMNSFDNHSFPERGVSKLCFVNELEHSLLLVASSDGSVRVWKDYAIKGKQRLATSWQALQGPRPGNRAASAVVDWQQATGYLYASAGESSSIVVWDLDRELLACTIQAPGESGISAMSASQSPSGVLAVGCCDGAVRIYDIRSHSPLVSGMRPHAHRVIGLEFQSASSAQTVVSASQTGDVKFLDLRFPSAAAWGFGAHSRGHLTALSVHRHAPVIATGSMNNGIRVFNLSGQEVSRIRYYNSFLAVKIGAVSCLSFHPYSVHLAAAAADSIVTIYCGESVDTREQQPS